MFQTQHVSGTGEKLHSRDTGRSVFVLVRNEIEKALIEVSLNVSGPYARNKSVAISRRLFARQWRRSNLTGPLLKAFSA